MKSFSIRPLIAVVMMSICSLLGMAQTAPRTIGPKGHEVVVKTPEQLGAVAQDVSKIQHQVAGARDMVRELAVQEQSASVSGAAATSGSERFCARAYEYSPGVFALYFGKQCRVPAGTLKELRIADNLSEFSSALYFPEPFEGNTALWLGRLIPEENSFRRGIYTSVLFYEPFDGSPTMVLIITRAQSAYGYQPATVVQGFEWGRYRVGGIDLQGLRLDLGPKPTNTSFQETVFIGGFEATSRQVGRYVYIKSSEFEYIFPGNNVDIAYGHGFQEYMIRVVKPE